ncbi:chorion protein ERB.1-like [Bombyx mandarina]|uniref:Chorion protein ERB.1-like n=1 Tax=Bombyx mandarina TaxID=7092 RepID=A0A6J2JHN5_BOMMA|nr:chorion protein ERB.1-like [Bombyx mandarina]
MAFKAILVFASALFLESALSQCLGRAGPGLGAYRGGWDGLGYDGLGYDGVGYGWNGRVGCGGFGDDIAAASALGASHGGTLAVVSSSAAPTGLGVTSENSYEGSVGVCGNLPFLSTAAVAGEFPTAGVGGINSSCGDGAIGITAEGGIGYAPAVAIAAPVYNAAPNPVYGAGISPAAYSGVNRGCGCGANYGY